MSLSVWLLLCFSMVVLALTPGPGMLAVIARSMASGFAHGAVTTIGIILGDYVFILLVFFGMAALASAMGAVFQWVAYIGGGYLIYLGLDLMRSPTVESQVGAVEEPSWWANCLAGFLITLSNPKAILFYAGFLPAFLHIPSTSYQDLLLILLAATISVGVSMLLYCWLASRAGEQFSRSASSKWIRIGAGLLLLGTGIYLLLK